MNKYNNKQYGAVSLFIVIFATLLMTIVTVGFVRIMLQGQQQASSTDLSQSAYDSALAGVEDAKRALLLYQNTCNTLSSISCTNLQKQIASSTCNDAVSVLSDVAAAMAASSSNEVNVQTGSTSNALNQAYTCVKIILNTQNYLGTLAKDESNIIPLVGVSPFNEVKIQWFDSKNSSTGSVSLASASTLIPVVPLMRAWSSQTPPIMRSQLMWFGGSGFKLTDFDSNTNSSTLFLYPAASGGLNNFDYNLDSRRLTSGGSGSQPKPVNCVDLLHGALYSCSATIKLPASAQQSMFLRLTSIYGGANYNVTLQNNGSVVEFSAVQPEIDSTGRADNLFRRVQTRVELTDTTFAYPNAAINIEGSFCKDFSITDAIGDYNVDSLGYSGINNNGKCTP